MAADDYSISVCAVCGATDVERERALRAADAAPECRWCPNLKPALAIASAGMYPVGDEHPHRETNMATTPVRHPASSPARTTQPRGAGECEARDLLPGHAPRLAGGAGGGAWEERRGHVEGEVRRRRCAEARPCASLRRACGNPSARP